MQSFIAPIAVLVAALLSVSTPSVAQSGEEIVVTGTKAIEWDPDEVPTIQLLKRADFLIVGVRVVNDTRDGAVRRREIVEVLSGMARGAERSQDIDLSLEEEGVLLPLTTEMVATMTLGVDGSRADTSVANLIVKTPIRAGDTLDAATRRIEAFVRGSTLSGRSLVNVQGDWQLSVVDPSRYRSDILTLIATDARTTAAAFGGDYAVQVAGLSNRVTWRQSGSLELSLFIPYDMTVTPRP